MKPEDKTLEDNVSDDDDGGLASELSDYEEEDEAVADLLDDAEEVADEDAEEYAEMEEDEWDEDAATAPDGLGDDDVPVPTRWRRQKKDKKTRIFEGSPLRSEPDDDIV